MSPEKRQAISTACRRMEIATCRIAAEVARVASEPDTNTMLDALVMLDEARRGGFRNFLREDS